MAVLLVASDEPVADVLVGRLIAAGDQVRVIEPRADRTDRWKALGAYVAPGDPADEDFVERAAGGARTVVLFDGSAAPELLAAAKLAGVGRVIVYGRRLGGRVEEVVAGSGLDFVILSGDRRGFRKLPAGAIAAAIDAADDLAGNPRLRLDLAQKTAWEALKLPEPNRQDP